MLDRCAEVDYRAGLISQVTVMVPLNKTIADTYRKLAAHYGWPEATHPKGKPLDVLIETILSQHTSDANSRRAYRELRHVFPRWDQVLTASPRAIEKAIRSGGLARQKSVRIKEVLRQIKEREGRIALARLGRMPPDEAYSYLASLPGVGGKTACCVLLFALGHPVMPVDTHIHRIIRRLGWVRPNARPDETRAVLEKYLSPSRLYHAHVLFIAHGRRICTARNPACGSCPLRSICPTGLKRVQKSVSTL